MDRGVKFMIRIIDEDLMLCGSPELPEGWVVTGLPNGVIVIDKDGGEIVITVHVTPLPRRMSAILVYERVMVSVYLQRADFSHAQVRMGEHTAWVNKTIEELIKNPPVNSREACADTWQYANREPPR